MRDASLRSNHTGRDNYSTEFGVTAQASEQAKNNTLIASC